MTIAIDFDQTYTADARMWYDAIKLMKQYGHNVICVTCRPEYDVFGMDQLEDLIGAENIFFTDNEAKIPYMEGRQHVDIWIDDCPATVSGGGKVMYKKNPKVYDSEPVRRKR
jgi:hypothetical protein